MNPSLFQPTKEHLGPFVKPEFNGSASHLGFNQAAEAIYKKGQSLVDSIQVLKPDSSFEWTAGNLFSGINPDLTNDFFNQTKSLLSIVQATTTLIVEVMTALNTLANLSANALKVVVEAVLDLIRSLVRLLNPAASSHVLLIPPRVGNSNNPALSNNNKYASSSIENFHKSSMDALESFRESLEHTSRDLPSFLRDKTLKLPSVSGRSTGAAYLLDTLKAKLKDRGDLCRPYLVQNSYWAGVGIFIGSNSITKVLNAWNRLNSLTSQTLEISQAEVPNLPSKPKIVRHNVTELAHLYNPTDSTVNTELGPVQESIVVSPFLPSKYTYGKVTYEFLKRVIYITKKSFLPNSPDSGKRYRNLQAYFTSSENTQHSLKNDSIPIEEFIVLCSMEPNEVEGSGALSLVVELGLGLKYKVPKWTRGNPSPKYSDLNGHYFLVAVDIYKVGPDTSEDEKEEALNLLPLISDRKTFVVNTQNPPLGWKHLSLKVSPKGYVTGSSGLEPGWVASPFILNMFPNGLREVLNFLDLLETYVKLFLNDALDWLTELIKGLQRYLAFINRILSAITRLIDWLQEITNLAVSLGASVMAFKGNGSTDSIISMFEEYLSTDNSTSSSVTSTISKLSTPVDVGEAPILTSSDLITGDIDSALVDATSVIEYTDSLKRQLGSIDDVLEKKRKKQRESLSQKRAGNPDSNSLNADSTLYSGSPIFPSDFTTCGLVLLAHSSTIGDVQTITALIEMLFNPQEKSPEDSEADTLEEVGLSMDIPTLAESASALTEESATLFTADMKLTSDPSKSPFNFCP